MTWKDIPLNSDAEYICSARRKEDGTDAEVVEIVNVKCKYNKFYIKAVGFTLSARLEAMIAQIFIAFENDFAYIRKLAWQMVVLI